MERLLGFAEMTYVVKKFQGLERIIYLLLRDLVDVHVGRTERVPGVAEIEITAEAGAAAENVVDGLQIEVEVMIGRDLMGMMTESILGGRDHLGAGAEVDVNPAMRIHDLREEEIERPLVIMLLPARYKTSFFLNQRLISYLSHPEC